MGWTAATGGPVVADLSEAAAAERASAVYDEVHTRNSFGGQ